MNKNFGFIVTISVLLFSSCKNPTTKKVNFHAFKSSDTADHVKIILPVVGSKYYYTIINETQTILEYNDKKTESGNKIEIGLIYESVVDSAGNHLLKVTYDKLHLLLKKPEGEQEYEAATNSSDLVEKLLGAIKGSSLYISLNKKGEIRNVKGSKEIADKVVASMQVFDPQIQRTLQEQVSQLVGDAFIKNNLEHGFKFFPDTTVSVGDSWTRKDAQSAGINYNALTTYTLESFDDSVALIETESEISTGEGGTSTIMGLPVIADLKGEQKGSIKVYTTSGFVVSNKSITSMKGTVQVMGRDVPVRIRMKKEIKSDKL